MKIKIRIGSTILLIGLAALLLPSAIMSENIQDRSITQQDITQSFLNSLTVSADLGLGASVPNSTTCSDQIYMGGKSQKTPPKHATLVLVPRNVVVHNNKIAVQYVLDTECSAICDGTNFHYERYYYGNNQWSNCFGKIQSCSPPCSSLR